MKAFIETAEQGMHIVSVDDSFALEIQPVIGWQYNEQEDQWKPMEFNEITGRAEIVYGYCQDKTFVHTNYTIIRALEPGAIMHCNEHEHGWLEKDTDIEQVREGTKKFIVEHFGEVGWASTNRMMSQLAEVWDDEVLHSKVDMLLDQAKKEAGRSK